MLTRDEDMTRADTSCLSCKVSARGKAAPSDECAKLRNVCTWNKETRTSLKNLEHNPPHAISAKHLFLPCFRHAT